jgi:hypothetical protein
MGTGFPKKIMLKQKIERDDDSKKIIALQGGGRSPPRIKDIERN